MRHRSGEVHNRERRFPTDPRCPRGSALGLARDQSTATGFLWNSLATRAREAEPDISPITLYTGQRTAVSRHARRNRRRAVRGPVPHTRCDSRHTGQVVGAGVVRLNCKIRSERTADGAPVNTASQIALTRPARKILHTARRITQFPSATPQSAGGGKAIKYRESLRDMAHSAPAGRLPPAPPAPFLWPAPRPEKGRAAQ